MYTLHPEICPSTSTFAYLSLAEGGYEEGSYQL